MRQASRMAWRQAERASVSIWLMSVVLLAVLRRWERSWRAREVSVGDTGRDRSVVRVTVKIAWRRDGSSWRIG